MSDSNNQVPDLVDAFTGEVFQPTASNHYEANDGIPVAPHVDIARPTVRQRVENLLRRGEDPLRHYVGTDGVDMEVPDDPGEALTGSEQNYLDMIAAEIAEAAPLPDEGLPRPTPAPGPASSSEVPSSGAPAAPPSGAAKGGSEPAASGSPSTVPTR